MLKFQALARYTVLKTKQKLLLKLFSYELTCNLFLPVIWTLTELVAGRPETDSMFWDWFWHFICLKRNYIYSWLLYISPIFIFKSSEVSAETELSFPCYRRTYFYSNSGCHLERVEVLGTRLQRVWWGSCVHSSTGSGTGSTSIGLLLSREATDIQVLTQALLNSIILAHTAFPGKNPHSAPAPAIAATYLWSESSGQCSGMKEGFSSMAHATWERDKRKQERPCDRQERFSLEAVLLRREQGTLAGGTELGRVWHEGGEEDGAEHSRGSDLLD